MKVTGHSMHALQGAAARQPARPRPDNATTTTTAPPPAAEPGAATSTPERAPHRVPPGLQRVAARLQGLGEEGRSPGQNNALSQIQRNLQRYVDVQALATAPATLPAQAPVSDGGLIDTALAPVVVTGDAAPA